MNQCSAILRVQHNHKIPFVQQCQNMATEFVGGHFLCGTHLNALERGNLQVITTLLKAGGVSRG